VRIAHANLVLIQSRIELVSVRELRK